MKYIIANWKANKTKDEVDVWMTSFVKNYKYQNNLSVVICSPFPFLTFVQEKITGLHNVYVGAQTVSSFDEGSYTGEVTAKSLSGIADYILIGHSERRKYFNEQDNELVSKANLAKKYGIEPIYCIRGEQDPIPNNVKFIAYEPIWAIGTGKNESLDDVLNMKKKLNISSSHVFIYGGSVNEINAKEYLASSEIGGLLPGKASLDVLQFLRLLES